jgi:hypothetical protein
MGTAHEIAALFHRDLTRLSQEIQAIPNDSMLWSTAPGVTNSAGNLVLHLEGNLREYIGRQLGGVPYSRQRDLEFGQTGLPAYELLKRVKELCELVPGIVSGLSQAEMEARYPEDALGVPLSTQQFLISLHGHLNYHLGQIDYLRRILTNGSAIEFAGL